MKNKYTLTIGIPAHNEEGNILGLLAALLNQTSRYYKLDKIVVVLDGCTDKTPELVSHFSKTHKKIVMLNDNKRKGKALRLNQIYKEAASSDFLLSLDADILPTRRTMIDNMVKTLSHNPETNVVGARFIAANQKSFMGKISVISYQSFEDAVLKLNNGNNIYALVGGAQIIRMSFGKKVHFPRGTVSDQNRLFMLATKNNPKGFILEKKSQVYMRTVSTFKDWRILGVRSTTTDRENVVSFFGNDVLKIYYMPKKLLIMSLMKYFFRHPVLTTGSVVMNLYIRVFPYLESAPENGIWISTVSSKIGMFT